MSNVVLASWVVTEKLPDIGPMLRVKDIKMLVNLDNLVDKP